MKQVFVDTNILVHVYDLSDPAKNQKARGLITRAITGHIEACISTQVLQEFYNVLTSKLKIAPADALVELHKQLKLKIVQISPAIIIEAAKLHQAASISFWDALIVCAAQSAHCEELWTEDMQSGRKHGSLTIVNPL